MRSGSLTLQAEFIPLQRSDGLPEKLLGMLISRLHSSDVDLLPLNRYIIGLEDRLDRFGNLSTNTVACIFV